MKILHFRLYNHLSDTFAVASHYFQLLQKLSIYNKVLKNPHSSISEAVKTFGSTVDAQVLKDLIPSVHLRKLQHPVSLIFEKLSWFVLDERGAKLLMWPKLILIFRLSSLLARSSCH